MGCPPSRVASNTDYTCHLSPHIDSFSVAILRAAHRVPVALARESRHVVLCTVCRAHFHISILSRCVHMSFYIAMLFTRNFAYLGMLACARKRYLFASLIFSLAAVFRSNGVMLALYVPWSLLIDPLLRSSTLPRPSVVFCACIHALIPLLPTFFHQLNAYRIFCVAIVTTDAKRPPWCDHLIPSIYTHVQRAYWQVGFLSYWTPAQLPNIALALPLLVPLLFYNLSHISSLLRGKSGGLRPSTTTAHAVHAIVFGITLLTHAHTQIALRVLPSLPSTYWAAATLLVERPRWGKAYVVWAVLWGIASVVLWTSFLPPA